MKIIVVWVEERCAVAAGACGCVCGSFITLGAYLTSHLESNRYRLQVRLLQRAPERLTGLASLQTHTQILPHH